MAVAKAALKVVWTVVPLVAGKVARWAGQMVVDWVDSTADEKVDLTVEK